MVYHIVRGGIVNIRVALFCLVGLNLLLDQPSWLIVIIVLESLCVCVAMCSFYTFWENVRPIYVGISISHLFNGDGGVMSQNLTQC